MYLGISLKIIIFHCSMHNIFISKQHISAHHTIKTIYVLTAAMWSQKWSRRYKARQTGSVNNAE